MIYSLNEIKNVPGKNFIWEKKGSIHPNEVIIVGANYDTLNHDPKTMKIDMKSNMPGADNNGSGTTMLLQMAKIFNLLDTPRTIRLVFLDAEEFGFLGSKAYIDTLKQNSNEKILGFVNLVMLGNDTKIKDTEKKFNNMKVYLRDPNIDKDEAQKDLSLVNTITNSGKAMYPMIEFKPVANGMNSSSQIRFWEAKIPALCFTQNWETDFNPRFHTPDDFVETINMNTYTNGLRYILSSLLALSFGIVK
jgi:Zn-dependent M28 family amino/carboxypeptidase